MRHAACGMGRVMARRKVIRLTAGESPVAQENLLAVEEPLEIRVGGRPRVVTMRTPGDDFDLAAGFLVSEGVITRGEHFNTFGLSHAGLLALCWRAGVPASRSAAFRTCGLHP